ncbi:putative TRAF-like signal transducer [Aspergillus lucknowensis]|uniref:Uncharacterized protein n=1 Tax=Aspergillus lucknowensis TaxID=176173 RepID=A0ABR4LCJ0_9EURO
MMKRAELGTHEQSCPLIAMGSYFEAQNARLDSMELTVRHLQQRNEIFEDGLSSIRSTLVESSRAFSAHHNAITNDTPEASSSSDPASRSHTHTRPPTNTTTDDASTPLSNATTYLLSLHESLREEVTQLSHAITDLDARASMAIMNECLRLKEDMAHTNAAVNSVRMQVQWLMNPRLHQGQRAAATTSGTAAGARSPPGDERLGAGASASGLLRSRRLSDTGREGTKL